MRLDELSVELRPRSAWEAVELGTALVRRHAGKIWRPWLWVTLPIFVILNAVGWALDIIGLYEQVEECLSSTASEDNGPEGDA
mgnify:CR=1 FL=1